MIVLPNILVTFVFAVGLDLWFNYRGYSNGIQDALPWLEVHLLYAKEGCI